MLTEEQCRRLELELAEHVKPKQVAVYICLHMGLLVSEITALRWQDVDFSRNFIVLNNVIARPAGCAKTAPAEFTSADAVRKLYMPPHVHRYLQDHAELYGDGERFILTGDGEVPPVHAVQNALNSLAKKCDITPIPSALDLRNTFIRRCIECGMDLYSICQYIGQKQTNIIAKRFEEYFKPSTDALARLGKFSADHAKFDTAYDGNQPKDMNLMILGAGSQGPVVKEIAEAIGIFREIVFLDDDPNNALAIGPLSDIEHLAHRYPLAAVSFGDCALRERFMDECEALGIIVPSLIHPSATVSPNAEIGRSVVIEARSVVSSGAKIERGVIVSSASVIGSNAHIGHFSHIGSSVTVEKNVAIPPYMRVPSGSVIKSQ